MQLICSFFYCISLQGVLMLDGVKDNYKADETSKNKGSETVWVEGLIPGIDFCNHGM